MKVIIAYPPLANQKGCPTLGQNRQFQYFHSPTYIYPVVPAYAATLLKQAGHEVLWLDCLAEGIAYDKFIEIIRREKPDLIALETKTPVVKQYWRIVDDLKHKLRTTNYELRTILFGDHVTALPEESFQNCGVDFVLAGGDYDFLLLNLCQAFKPLPTTYCLLPTKLEPGIYYRDNGQVKNTGKFKLDHNLDSLPFIDRELTKWELYAFNNGNYKRTPGTYIMSGRDCWWGKCGFCSWPVLYPQFRVRTPEKVLDEIGGLIERCGVREIMDDTGTLPVGQWLRLLCEGMIKRGYNKKIYLDCNMRFGALSAEEFRLMKKANFRLLLFGMESANQSTLDRLNKNLHVEQIIQDCRLATQAGLFPHITIMFGFPWESYEDALNTLKLGKWLLKKGYAYTMQATVAIPYPGSPLFQDCKANNLLKALDWDDYDMRRPVMASSVPDGKIMGLAQGMYKVSFTPEFILRKLFSLRDAEDLKYYLRAAAKVMGHIFDFNRASDCRAQ
jgi:radical SAM superfamily enzyme YgiQ (UPF0313 family)